VSVTLDIAVNSARQADAGSVLAAAQRGDAAAQAELFDRHRQRVARQVLRMTGDVASLDDIVQEVFIAVFTALPGFRRDAQFETWLYTIAANKVRNWWDARRRRTAREQQVANAHVDPPTTPEESLESQERLGRFYDALGRLPDKFREAFTARAIEHLSLQDASTVLGVPVSTVSYRTRRAEEMLCDMLGLQLPPGRGVEASS
jgi:RNA polymerase sigma-70 factor, ECF subfamily